MQWSTARAFLLTAALASGAPHDGAAESPHADGLVAQELSAVVSISGLRPPPPAAGTTVPPRLSAIGASATSRARLVGHRHTRGEWRRPTSRRTTPAAPLPRPRIRLHHRSQRDHRHQQTRDRGNDRYPRHPAGQFLLRATVLAQADQIDVALLKVAADSPLPSIRWGDSDTLRVADEVLAIGNPLGFGGSVTQGIVSALNRDIRDTPFDDYIQTDAAINHGNSGGPLFNMRGDVVGMNTAIFAPAATSGSIGLGFAIPSNDIRFVAEALRNPGGMRPGTLDFRLQQVTAGLADALNMPKAEGVIVGGTKEGGAAAKCGIVAGDIILRYGTMEVKDVRALARAIARTKPGTVVNLLVWHNEEPKQIAATVQALPAVASPAPARPAPPASPADPGWTLAPIDDAARHTYGLGDDQTGVVVTQVAADGSAADAGLNPGDVLEEVQQETIAAPEDVTRLIALARQQQRRYVAMLVHNADGLRWLAMSLD